MSVCVITYYLRHFWQGIVFTAICLFVSRMTQKVIGGFSQNLGNRQIVD